MAHSAQSELQLPVPKILGHYSTIVTDGRTQVIDEGDQRLRCLRVFNTGIFSETIHFPRQNSSPVESSYKLKDSHLVDHLKRHKYSPQNREGPFDFVTSRATLIQIMCGSEYKLIAQIHNGTIYLFYVYTEEKERAERGKDDYQWRSELAGEYFEGRATLPFDDSCQHQATGFGRDHFFCVFSNTYRVSDKKSISILFSGEMDALKSESSKKDGPSQYMEIKLTSNLSNKKPFWWNRIWCQCVLSGMKEAVIGDRNDWICNKVERFTIEQIEAKANGDNPNNCQNFKEKLLGCLNHIKNQMTGLRDGILVEFEAREIKRMDPSYEKYVIIENVQRPRIFGRRY